MKIITCFNKHFLKTVFFSALFFLSAFHSFGQQSADYTVQANIIYRFTKYIKWPEYKQSGDFIIGVVGETPLYEELKEFVKNKYAGNQKIVIRKLSLKSSVNCHILFVSEAESRSMKKIAAITADKAILIVSELPGLARKGSCINFIIDDDRLKLEINKNNIESQRLGIASELLQLGISIK